MANIARLGVALGLNSAEFVSGINAAGKKLEDFANKAVGYAKIGATAFAAMTTAAMAFADEVADVAKANDVAIDSVIKLQNALANSGGSAENAGKLLSSFTKYVDDAAGGSFEAQQKLSKLGLSLKDLGNLSTEDLFKKTIQGIASIEDPLTRNARAMDAFGKAAKGVDWTGVAEGMADGTEGSRKQAQAVQDAADAFDILKQNARDFNLLLAETLGPSLKLTLEYIKSLKGESNLLGTAFKTVFQTVAVLGSDLQFIFEGISDEISHTIQSTKILATEGIKAAAAYNEAYDKRRQKAREDLDLFQARIMGTDAGYQGKGFDDPRIVKPKSGGGPARVVKPGTDPEAKKDADKRFEVEKARLAAEFSLANQFLSEQQKNESEYKRKTAEAELERTHKNAAENNKFAIQNEQILQSKLLVIKQEYEEKKKQLITRNAVEEAKMQIASAEEAALEESKLNQFYSEGNTAIRATQDSENTALDRAQQLFELEQRGRFLKAEELQQEKEILQQQWKHQDALEQIRAMQNLDQTSRAEAIARENNLNQKALDNIKERGRILAEQKSGGLLEGFVSKMDAFGRNLETSFETGGKAFDSLMNNMTNALDKFVSTGKLNFGDFAKSIIKDMLAIQLRASATSLFSMLTKSVVGAFTGGALAPIPGPSGKAFADGGDPPVGVASLVGERGPELFVPRVAGTIIPNHMLGQSQAGPTINYNGPYIASMSAIDTQSGLQFLAKNKQSVWAAYQSANRSVPMSR